MDTGYNSTEKIKLLKILINEIGNKLSPIELVILIKIFDRTILWGKKEEIITLNHFIEGISTKEGFIVCGGLETSKPTILKAIKSLRCKGYLILKKNHDNLISYEINFKDKEKENSMYEKDKKINILKDGRSEILNPPSKNSLLPSTKFFTTPSKESLLPLVKNFYPNNININKLNKMKLNKTFSEENKFLRNENLKPEEKIQEIKNKEKTRFISKKQFTAKDLEKFWAIEIKKIFPEYNQVPFTVRDLAIAKKLLKNLLTVFSENSLILKFMAWAIINWKLITEYHLAFLDEKKNKYPSMPLLLRFLGIFVNQYNDKENESKLRELDRKEKIKTELIRKGYKKEEIESVIDEIEDKEKSIKEKRKLEKQILELKKQKTTIKQTESIKPKRLKLVDYTEELQAEELA